MRKPWGKQIARSLVGVAVAFLIVNLSTSGGWKIALPLVGVSILSFLVTVPHFAALVLYSLRLRKLAARYAGWASRHYPLTEERSRCALVATRIYASLGDKEKSLAYAEIGMALCEKRLDHPRMRAIYAHCLDAKGTYALGRGEYRNALDAYSIPLRMKMQEPLFNALFYNNSAAALYGMGRFTEALSMATFACVLAAGGTTREQELRAVAHHNAAITLIELGRAADALEETQAAVELKGSPPSQALVRATHGWTLWLHGNEGGAESSFGEGQRLLPPKTNSVSQTFYGLRGQMRAAQGRFEEAKADFLLAAEGDVVAPFSYYHLARLADKSDNPVETTDWRARLLREAPESFYAQRVRDETPGMV